MIADADASMLFAAAYSATGASREIIRSVCHPGRVAPCLRDLRSPPGNRLEPLHGDHAGQYSIRINEQWRICFYWEDGKAKQVKIEDCHG